MEENFTIDFFMLQKLAEACFSSSTVLECLVLQELVDKHYDLMSDDKRKAFYTYFKEKYQHDWAYLDNDAEYMWRLILARFNPDNKYRIGIDLKTVYFQFDNRFFRNTRQFVQPSDDLVVIRLTKTNEE